MNTNENGIKNVIAQKTIFKGGVIGTKRANGISITSEGIKKIISLSPTFGISSNCELTFFGMMKSLFSKIRSLL
jgi:hypothetical protein